MRRLLAAILAATLSVCLVAQAKEAPLAADDPVLEARLQKLSTELRCLVCQNQTLADSHAELAVDLRNRIRELMKQGQTDAQVIDFLVARYGEFVLYRPRFEIKTILLWLGPALLVIAGLGALVATQRRARSGAATAGELTPEEHARASAMLRGEEGTAPRP